MRLKDTKFTAIELPRYLGGIGARVGGGHVKTHTINIGSFMDVNLGERKSITRQLPQKQT